MRRMFIPNYFRVFVAAVAMALAASLFALVGPLASSGNTQEGDTPPPTLTGENLHAATFDIFGSGTDQHPGEVEFAGGEDCFDTSQSEVTLSYEASGPAVGPYPGTFEETGQVTLGAPDSTFPGSIERPIEAFSAEFTIDSPVGQVTGTKSAGDEQTVAICNEREPWRSPGDRLESVSAALFLATYKATIKTPSESSFRDSGTTQVVLSDERYYSTAGGPLTGVFAQFEEQFFSDLTETEPLLPTAKKQCKDGGWEDFGVFKNKGDCLSFVATDGKNPPDDAKN